MPSYKSFEPCVCCGWFGDNMTCYHHIYTRKAYPEFSQMSWNKISLCQDHHNLFHLKGNDYMVNSFPEVKEWFSRNNWVFVPAIKKWMHTLGPI